jgi:hypothetical protein
MSAILHCYVDARTLAILERESAARGRSLEDLAETAIAEAALAAERDRPMQARSAAHPPQNAIPREEPR